MKTLVTIRDSIKDFVSKYEKFVMPVIKFLLTFLVLVSFNSVMGYSSDMSSPAFMFLVSLICAFLPIQLTVLFVGIIGGIHMYAVSLEIAATYAGLFILMYLLYLRFAPKYGWIVILTPLFYMMKLHYVVPIVVGIFIGPVGIVPAAFGVIFYYFTQHVSDLVDLLATVSEEDSIQGFSYILNGLLQDKEMLLTIVVFALVIAITYLIYKQSFQYSWMIAIAAGAVLSIVLFLMGGIVLEADIDIVVIFIGTVVGALLALVAQFFKGVLDYSRTENVQFEDDEYYYYVKAVPKVRVAEQNVKVKKINEKKKDLTAARQFNDRTQASSRTSQRQTPVHSRQGQATTRTQQGQTQRRSMAPDRTYTSAQRQTQSQVYNQTRSQVQGQRRSEGQRTSSASATHTNPDSTRKQ
jgi:hypothetical protein